MSEKGQPLPYRLGACAGCLDLAQQLALSMARQETLASNVNDGLLEHRALREQLAQAEEEIAFWKLQAVDR